MNKIIAVFLLALCMTICVTTYSDGVQADLQDNLIRLHISRGQHDDNDQAVKLKVRDAILKNVGDRLSKTDKNECRDEIINDLNEFEDIANDVLRENGFSYTAHAEYGKFEFPEKTYKSMVLPAGEYYGVRIVLAAVKDIIGGALCIRRCALKRARRLSSVKKAKKFYAKNLIKILTI